MSTIKNLWKKRMKQQLPGFLLSPFRSIVAYCRPRIFYTKQSFITQNQAGQSAIPARFNYERATPLCRLMKEQGTDKALYSGTSKHNYTTFYYQLFKKLRYNELFLLELGIGTTNPAISANMGSSGVPGASLRGWKEFFYSGKIYGADIDRSILFEEGRIKTFYCDQTDPHSIISLWQQRVMPPFFDIIIDDGLHVFEANCCFFEQAIQKLKKGGIYIVEDVLQSDIPRWKQYLAQQGARYPGIAILLLQIPNPFNSWDNNLVVMEKQF